MPARHWHGLLCPIWEPTQWQPDEDESHRKEVITYHFLSVFAYSFSYSCSHSDCTGFHELKPRVDAHTDKELPHYATDGNAYTVKKQGCSRLVHSYKWFANPTSHLKVCFPHHLDYAYNSIIDACTQQQVSYISIVFIPIT